MGIVKSLNLYLYNIEKLKQKELQIKKLKDINDRLIRKNSELIIKQKRYELIILKRVSLHWDEYEYFNTINLI